MIGLGGADVEPVSIAFDLPQRRLVSVFVRRHALLVELLEADERLIGADDLGAGFGAIDGMDDDLTAAQQGIDDGGFIGGESGLKGRETDVGRGLVLVELLGEHAGADGALGGEEPGDVAGTGLTLREELIRAAAALEEVQAVGLNERVAVAFDEFDRALEVARGLRETFLVHGEGAGVVVG